MTDSKIKSCSRQLRLAKVPSLFLLGLMALSSLAAAATGGTTGSNGHRISPELLQAARVAQENGSDSQLVPVIVQFKHAPTPSQLQAVTKAGGVHVGKLQVIKGSVFNVPLNALERLVEDPEVAYISKDRGLRASNDYAEATVGADVAQSYNWDGTGIGVAVIDSGISDHPDLHDPATGASRVVYNRSFVPLTDASDQYGHGTHVAGILAGNGSQSSGYIYGVAPNVRLINLKVLDANGFGQDSYVIAAIQQAIALKNLYNIRVVNLSIGRPVYESFTQDPLCQAVESAWKAGLVVVVAAGNSGRDTSLGTNGYATISVPGNDPYVITVGAMNTSNTPSKADDVITTYSSKGPSLLDHIVKPDLVAPGNRMTSLMAANSTLARAVSGNPVNSSMYMGHVVSNSYMVLSGTSMATPVVSGAAVLMMQEYPTLTPDGVKARLMKSHTWSSTTCSPSEPDI